MSNGRIYVGATATKIISENCSRKVLWLTNASANSTIGIAPDSTMTSLTAGALLLPYASFEDRKNFGDYKGDIYGATLDSVGGAWVHYWEVT